MLKAFCANLHYFNYFNAEKIKVISATYYNFVIFTVQCLDKYIYCKSFVLH